MGAAVMEGHSLYSRDGKTFRLESDGVAMIKDLKTQGLEAALKAGGDKDKEEDRDVDAVDRERLSQPDDLRADWGLMAHMKWMKKRWKAFETLFGPWSGQGPERRCAPTLLIDGANGFATEWLAGFLSEQGVACAEVGSPTGVLNDACGAGDFSPTQTWTFDEAEASPHALIRRLERAEPGQLVGAALDGDGDAGPARGDARQRELGRRRLHPDRRRAHAGERYRARLRLPCICSAAPGGDARAADGGGGQGGWAPRFARARSVGWRTPARGAAVAEQPATSKSMVPGLITAHQYSTEPFPNFLNLLSSLPSFLSSETMK